MHIRHVTGRGVRSPCLEKSYFWSVWCFFFQAEDGIRDDLVTGVQTCALPISHRARRHRAGGPPGGHRGGAHVAQARSEERRVGEECRSRGVPYHLKKKKEKREYRQSGCQLFIVLVYETLSCAAENGTTVKESD